MRYDFEIFHTPGSKIYLADALSRLCSGFDGSTDSDKAETLAVEEYVRAIVDSSLYSNCCLEEIQEAVADDKFYHLVTGYLVNGWPPSYPGDAPNEFRRLYGCQYRLTVIDSLLYYDARVYSHQTLRGNYLELCLEGHQGITKCRRRAQRQFWWPGLSFDIQHYVEKCNTCIIHGQVKHQPQHEMELPSGPWEVVGSDIFTLDGELYLVVIDYYTRWIETVHIHRQTAQAVIQAMKYIYSRLGILKVVRSDNGPCYNCDEFLKFAKNFGFRLVTSSPRYPESNGMAEGAVKTVKRLWKKSADKDSALIPYRTTPPLATGYSPSELMLGRSVRTLLGTPRNSRVDYNDFEHRDLELKETAKV